MKGHLTTLMMLLVPMVLVLSSPTAHAAKSPAMESCSAEWKRMKGAGTIPPGQTWPKFWSQCSKDYAAAHPDQATAGQGAAAASQPAATKKAASTKTATAESDTAGSGEQKKQCDAKWGAYKSRTGAHGWHDYFQFMANCM